MFCSLEHPIILVIDDLQWADLDSLKVLQAIIESQEINNLLVVGIYRDEKIHDAFLGKERYVRARITVLLRLTLL